MDKNSKKKKLKKSESDNNGIMNPFLDSDYDISPILNSFPDPVIIYDMSGEAVYINSEFTNLFGWTIDELEGKRVDFVPEEYLSKTLEKIKHIKNGESVIDFETMRQSKDGTQISVSISSAPLLDRNGNFIGSIAVHRDITIRKFAESALQDSEERYRSVLEANPDPVVIYDMSGNVIYINPAFTDVFDWKLEDIIGRKLDFVPEHEWPETMKKIELIRKGESFSGFQTVRYNKKRKLIDISMSASVWSNGEGVPKGSVINLRDIREQKKMENQLRHVQKMQAVGTLAGGIAHDFNNILQGISGYVQLIMRDKNNDSEDYESLEKINMATERASDLIKQLLTISRKMESRLEPVNLNNKIVEICKLFERTIPRMINIEMELDKNLNIINADTTQLEQIILNLGSNAKDAMDEGGTLLFKTQNIKAGNPLFRSIPHMPPGEYVNLSVSDTGYGMEHSVIEKIFDPFFTTKEIGKGTGLGLSTIYGIVKSHEGFIHCESEPGVGTIFNIVFPAMGSDAGEREKTELRIDDIPGGSENILIVDDEEFILDIVEDILHTDGYTCLKAKSGESAIEIYESDMKNIDLVILDLSMPGMGGHKCWEKLKIINSDVKVLFSSGYSNKTIPEEVFDSKNYGFIGKPYRLSDMLREIRKLLDVE